MKNDPCKLPNEMRYYQDTSSMDAKHTPCKNYRNFSP